MFVNLYNLSFLVYICDEGDLVDAVVPFMGESISDGTLAKFLKSMFPSIQYPMPSSLFIFIVSEFLIDFI